MDNIIHTYYKKVIDDVIILVRFDPETFQGMELMIGEAGMSKRKMIFDEQIEEDLKHDGFRQSGALEFNLYLKGLVRKQNK
jgi:hypothetical protein